jgi:hypothetical protein
MVSTELRVLLCQDLPKCAFPKRILPCIPQADTDCGRFALVIVKSNLYFLFSTIHQTTKMNPVTGNASAGNSQIFWSIRNSAESELKNCVPKTVETADMGKNTSATTEMMLILRLSRCTTKLSRGFRMLKAFRTLPVSEMRLITQAAW